jgi:hypothetical protein
MIGACGSYNLGGSATYYISQSQCFGGLRGGPELSGRVVPYRLEGNRHQPRWGTADDGDLVDFQVYTLCRVDQSIRIAASADMDIPMTYASLD